MFENLYFQGEWQLKEWLCCSVDIENTVNWTIRHDFSPSARPEMYFKQCIHSRKNPYRSIRWFIARMYSHFLFQFQTLTISYSPFQALMQTARNWREYLVLIRKPKFHPDILQESKEVRHLILHHITKLFKLVDLEE